VRAVVCSAMGKTTNGLLSAGDFALGKCASIIILASMLENGINVKFLFLEGRVNIDALKTLHMQAITEFGLSDNVKDEVGGQA